MSHQPDLWNCPLIAFLHVDPPTALIGDLFSLLLGRVNSPSTTVPDISWPHEDPSEAELQVTTSMRTSMTTSITTSWELSPTVVPAQRYPNAKQAAAHPCFENMAPVDSPLGEGTVEKPNQHSATTFEKIEIGSGSKRLRRSARDPFEPPPKAKRSIQNSDSTTHGHQESGLLRLPGMKISATTGYKKPTALTAGQLENSAHGKEPKTPKFSPSNFLQIPSPVDNDLEMPECQTFNVQQFAHVPVDSNQPKTPVYWSSDN